MDFTIKVFDNEYKLSRDEEKGLSNYYNNGFFHISIDTWNRDPNRFTLYIPDRFFASFQESSNRKYDFSYDYGNEVNYVILSSKDIPKLEKYLELYLLLVKKGLDKEIQWIKDEFGTSFSNFEAMKEII